MLVDMGDLPTPDNNVLSEDLDLWTQSHQRLGHANRLQPMGVGCATGIGIAGIAGAAMPRQHASTTSSSSSSSSSSQRLPIPVTNNTMAPTATINNPAAGGVVSDKQYPHPSLMSSSSSSSSSGGTSHSMKAEGSNIAGGLPVASATLGGAGGVINSVSEYQQFAHYNQFHGPGT